MQLGMGSVAPDAKKVLPVAKVRCTLWPDVVRADDTLKSKSALLRFAPEKNHKGVAEVAFPGAKVVALAICLSGKIGGAVRLLPEVPPLARHASNGQQLWNRRRRGNDAAEGGDDLAAPVMNGCLGLAPIQQNAAVEVWPNEDNAKGRVLPDQAKSGLGSQDTVRRQTVAILAFSQALCHGNALI